MIDAMFDRYENTPTMGACKTDLGIVRSLRLAAKRIAQKEKLGKSMSPQLEKRVRKITTKEDATPVTGVKKIFSPKSAKRTSDGEARKKVVMAALHNLGNTCFMNSILQVLYHTPQFCEKIHVLGSEVKSTLLSLDILEQLNYKELPCGDHLDWTLVSRLDKLLKQMKKIDDDIAGGGVVQFTAVRPYDLLDAIEEINSDFQGNQPQDAHELLKCLLMIVDETTSKLNRSRFDIKRCIDAISPILIASPRVKSPMFTKKTEDSGVSEVFSIGDGVGSSRRNFPNRHYDRIPQSIDDSEIVASLEPDLNVVKFPTASPDVNVSSQLLKRGTKFDSPTSSVENCAIEKAFGKGDRISFKVEAASSCILPSSFCAETVQSPCGVRVSLPRLDTLQGLHQANISTGFVSNMVTELFQGYMSLRTKCLKCGMESLRKEEFQEISLSIRRETVTSTSNNEDGLDVESDPVSVLELILSILDEVEQLDCDNLYLCNNCRHLVKAERRLSYELLPNVLTIHLKRFASSLTGNFTKTSDSVDIPLELPCLETACRNMKTPCHRYHLYGIVSHSGKSLLSGHYRAYIRVPSPNNSPIRCCSPVVQLHSIASNTISSPNSRIPDGKCSFNMSQNVFCTPSQDNPTPESSDMSSRKRKKSPGSTSVRKSTGQGTRHDMSKDSLHATWYQCNDDVVTLVNTQQLMNLLRASGSNTPYMLFYHKVVLSAENLTVCTNH